MHPRSFDGLTKLQVLALSRNSLTDIPSKVLAPLTNLQILKLDGNQVMVVPKGK